jgi:acetyltransferase-like isoleucine patch superfamily enzyme
MSQTSQSQTPSASEDPASSSAGGSGMRVLAGSLLSYAYNSWIGRLPSRHLRRLFLRSYLARLGAGSGVQLGCRFLNGRKVSLGARNVINFGTLIDGRRYPVETGDDVSIGPEAAILTLGHDPQSPDFADRGGPVVIGARAWIAFRAIILPGVTIGEGAVIAAGAVVARDVAPYSIVAGSPARQVGERNRDLRYQHRFDPFLT